MEEMEGGRRDELLCFCCISFNNPLLFTVAHTDSLDVFHIEERLEMVCVYERAYVCICVCVRVCLGKGMLMLLMYLRFGFRVGWQRCF